MILEVNGWIIRLEDAGQKMSIMRRNATKFECAGPDFVYDATHIGLVPRED